MTDHLEIVSYSLATLAGFCFVSGLLIITKGGNIQHG